MAEITDDIRALLLDPDFPDAEIAELASVPVDEVPRLRVWAGLADTVQASADAAGPTTEAVEDEDPTPEPAPEPAKPTKGKAKSREVSVTAGVRFANTSGTKADLLTAAKSAFQQTTPAEEATPNAVRVTKRGGSTAAPSGVIGLRVGIIYRGADAAHLWQHHRDKVEPYPTKG